MLITHKIKMDLQNRNEIQWLQMVQGDANTRRVAISLYNSNVIWPVPEETTAILRYSKPDGTGGAYDTLPDGTSAIHISEYTITVTLAPQVLTVPGVVTMSLTLLKDGTELNTFRFYIDVQENVNAEITESGDYYSLTGILQKICVTLSDEEKMLLLKLLSNGVYTGNMHSTISRLKALWNPQQGADVTQIGDILWITAGVNTQQNGTILAIL